MKTHLTTDPSIQDKHLNHLAYNLKTYRFSLSHHCLLINIFICVYVYLTILYAIINILLSVKSHVFRRSKPISKTSATSWLQIPSSVLWFHLSKATGGIFVLACRHVVPCCRHKPSVGIPNEWVELIYAEWYWKAWKNTYGVILFVYTSIMSYGQNLVHGEGTSLSRVGTYQFCGRGGPMTHNTTLVIPISVRF